MSYIVSYQKKTLGHEVIDLLRPARTSMELGTLDGITYVAIRTEQPLPEQRPELGEVSVVEPTPALRERLCEVSPQVQLIRQRVRNKIAERYRLHDEIQLLRTGDADALAAYNQYVEDCRAWGRAKKAELGL